MTCDYIEFTKRTRRPDADVALHNHPPIRSSGGEEDRARSSRADPHPAGDGEFRSGSGRSNSHIRPVVEKVDIGIPGVTVPEDCLAGNGAVGYPGAGRREIIPSPAVIEIEVAVGVGIEIAQSRRARGGN